MPVEVAAEEQMLYWLGRAAKEIRDEAGLTRSQVAGALAVDQSKIQRFELGHSWPHDIDSVLNAYASLAELEHPREVWKRALKLWNSGT